MTDTGILITKLEGSIKTYPNTLQRLAKNFWYTGQYGNTIEFADELEQQANIAVVCVTDEQRRPLGIVRREQLFLVLSRRFGREVMSKKTVLDCLEEAPVYSGERNILLVQERLPRGNDYIVLVDSRGIFSGILSMRDIADYMVEMTNDDIGLASLLQDRFLSNTDKIDDFGVNVDAWWSSAKGVGGDFYFIKKINDDQFFASLCDVSGKGVAAALVVSMAWGFMRGHTMQNGLKDLLTRLNESIISSFHMEKYLTGFFMIYDRQTRRIHIADMGHAHTVFLRKGNPVSLKKTLVNLPIGVEVEIDPVIHGFQVQNGDILLIYTDGIPEQDNPEGEEFSEERIIALVKQVAEQNVKLSETLPETLDEFRLYTPQRDDMTFLLFRF